MARRRAHPPREARWLRRENTGVATGVEVASDGMRLVTIGDLIAGDVRVDLQKKTPGFARGP